METYWHLHLFSIYLLTFSGANGSDHAGKSFCSCRAEDRAKSLSLAFHCLPSCCTSSLLQSPSPSTPYFCQNLSSQTPSGKGKAQCLGQDLCPYPPVNIKFGRNKHYLLLMTPLEILATEHAFRYLYLHNAMYFKTFYNYMITVMSPKKQP